MGGPHRVTIPISLLQTSFAVDGNVPGITIDHEIKTYTVTEDIAAELTAQGVSLLNGQGDPITKVLIDTIGFQHWGKGVSRYKEFVEVELNIVNPYGLGLWGAKNKNFEGFNTYDYLDYKAGQDGNRFNTELGEYLPGGDTSPPATSEDLDNQQMRETETVPANSAQLLTTVTTSTDTLWLLYGSFRGKNTKPVANDDTFDLIQTTALTVTAPGVLANDVSGNVNPTFTATKLTDPTHGSVSFNSDGSFTYTPSGSYYGNDSFTYKANDGNKNSVAATVTLNVLPPIIVLNSFFTPSSAWEGEEATFYAVATGGVGPLTYSWDFGDGSSASGIDLTATSHAFDTNDPETTPYTVILTISDGVSTISQSNELLIINLPPIVDAGPPQTTHQGATISFAGQANDPGTSTDIDSIEWDFDYRGTFTVDASGTLALNFQYDFPGAYIVALRVTDSAGAASLGFTTVEVRGTGALVVNAGSDQYVFIGDEATFTGGYSGGGTVSSSDIEWDFEFDGTFEATASGTLSPTYSFSSPGTYKVALRVTDDQNSSEIDVITVTADYVGPTADAGEDLMGAVGETVTFNGSATDPDGTVLLSGVAWDFDYDGTFTPDITGTWSPTFQYDAPGRYAVALQVTDDHGIESIGFLVVTVSAMAPYVFAGIDNNVPEGDSVTFGGSYRMLGSVTSSGIEWDFDYDGTAFNPDSSATGNLRPIHLFDTPGTYTVALRVTDSTPVSEIDTIVMTVVNARPIVNVSSPITIIQGQNASFSVTVSCPDPVTVEWDFEYGAHDTFTPNSSADELLNPTHQYLVAGTHWAAVQVTNTVGGAIRLGLVKVTVENVPPTATVTNSGPVPEGSAVQFTVSELTEINPDADIEFEADWIGTDEFQSIPANLLTVDPVTGAISFAYVYDDNGTYTATIRISDGEGGFSDISQTVTVTNVAPTVAISPSVASGISTIGPGVPIRLVATDPSRADTSAGFTYFLSVNGGSYAENASGEFSLPSYAPGTYTLSGYVVDKNGGTSEVAETSVTVSEASMVFENNGTGSVRLTWTGAVEPVTLNANQSYDFGGAVSGLAVTLLTSGATYDLQTNGSIEVIDFEPGIVGVSLSVDTWGQSLMDAIVGDGHVGDIFLPGGNATAGPSSLILQARGNLGNIVGPTGTGRLWAEALDLHFVDLTGSITGLDSIQQIEARWLGDSSDDQVWANYEIQELSAYGISASVMSDRLRSTFDPSSSGSTISVGPGGASGWLDFGKVELFSTSGTIDRLRIKQLSGEVTMGVGSGFNQLQIDDTAGDTAIRGPGGRIDLLVLGKGAEKNLPTVDYFPLAELLYVNAKPADDFWATIPGGKIAKWEVHHTYPNDPELAARLLQERKINIQDPIYLRGVPEEIHRNINGLQTSWRAKEMQVMGLNPNNEEDVAKFWKRVDLKKLEALNKDIAREAKDFWLTTGAKQAEVTAKKALASKAGALAGAKVKFLNLRAALKLTAKVVAVFAVFETFTFAANVVNESPDAAGARFEFMNLYVMIVETAERTGAPPQKQDMHNLVDLFNKWMIALEAPDNVRNPIYTALKAAVDLEFP